VHPELFENGEFDVVGQVTGVAMLLKQPKRGSNRAAERPEVSADR
jgi:hypothetical protein